MARLQAEAASMEEQPVVVELVAPYSAVQLVDGVASELAFVFAFRGFDGSPLVQVHKQGSVRPYNDDSGSAHNAN